MSFFVCYCSLIFIIYNYTYLAIGLVPLDHQHISVYLLSLFFCHVHHFCAVKPNNNNNNESTEVQTLSLNIDLRPCRTYVHTYVREYTGSINSSSTRDVERSSIQKVKKRRSLRER